MPVLGICYGMQYMAEALGGKVSHAEARHEFGPATITLTNPSKLFAGLHDIANTVSPSTVDVWMSHADRVTTLPSGFVVDAETANAPIAAMSDVARQLYGLQFHPEVTHTPKGRVILENFLHQICDCQPSWTVDNILSLLIEDVRQQVSDSEKVLLAVSGGVDSSVLAMLLHKALGDRLHCVFVDNGLLRLHEAKQVKENFTTLGIAISYLHESDIFLNRLKGITDPEKKRHIIGNTFIELFEQYAAERQNHEDFVWLAQGTIYPDVIESAQAGAGANVIKSHHNVGGLPAKMGLKLLEPLRMLFKDEVRKLGAQLGLSKLWLNRHPFPGPGLAVRILAEVKPEYLAILRQADAIYMDELHQSGWYDKLAQAFAVFIPQKTVGVTGDARRYAWVIALRAVETTDFMTARWAHLPHDLLAKISTRIMNELPEVSRVCYDISNKPPATIEWE